MGTGIITNGTNVFTDIVGKLGNITTEFVPYIIYIGIALIGFNLTIYVVKYILNYLKYQSENTFGERYIDNREIRVQMPEETKEDLINEYNNEYEKTLETIGYEGIKGNNDGIERMTLKENGDIEYSYGAFGDRETIRNYEYNKHSKERIKGRIKRIKQLRE